ncbi:DUF2393 family protein [Helicobacter sp. 12S02232-10]|uniref:DUF2393 family protein n=1 Tax=Helicobacter sp. 12S02232-10 TaxID=1476197 RepID=UPI000BA76307|nr:DUF2393 family protein [Helicobacter sp. 12S02232-10]
MIGIIQEIKALFLTVFHRLGPIEIVLFLSIFVVFIFVFTLGLIWHSKRLFAQFCFLLSFVILFSSPFLIKYLMQEKIYKIQISYYRSSPLQYADTFLVDMDIKNLGKKDINKCIVKVDIFRKGTDFMNRLKNIFYPEKSFTHLIEEKIRINQTHHFLIMIDDFYYKTAPYKVGTDCF